MSDEPTNVTNKAENEPRGLFARMKAGISRNVVVLGLVSFFTDASSEMIIPMRILFLVLVLQTPLPIAGFIEGIAESTASLLKIWAGHLSNRVSRRTPLINFGYNLSNLAKPLLAFVPSWPYALGLIFLDRVGKGVRGSPRDAMMANSTPQRYMGKAFGFHRSMDTFGAAFGPIACYLILLLTAGDLRAVLIWTAIPGFLAAMVMVLFLREKTARTEEARLAKAEAKAAEVKKEQEQAKARISPKQFGIAFWMFTAISGVFALGNSSDAFIFLRTADLETSVVAVPLIYFLYNLVYAVLATPMGALSDKIGRLPILMLGYGSFALVYLGWASATQGWQAWALFSLYGVYAAATEGVAKAFVSDLIPKSVRGSAMGWFNGVIGFSALPANVLGGWLWSVAGAPSTFVFGAWMSLFALGLMIVWLPWLRKRKATSPVPAATVTA